MRALQEGVRGRREGMEGSQNLTTDYRRFNTDLTQILLEGSRFLVTPICTDLHRFHRFFSGIGDFSYQLSVIGYQT